jgi:hypothetical protein
MNIGITCLTGFDVHGRAFPRENYCIEIRFIPGETIVSLALLKLHVGATVLCLRACNSKLASYGYKQ